ncbi:cysteine hydrolase family protein [Rhodococcus wratislaviensis]|uniref:cysteine hydrolase family protein n=1 Tax=Rhodococcus wratislaviensis TaxID=44752 RepID=UPI00364FCD30
MPTNETISLDPTRTALVNVHWQHDIVTPEGAFAPYFAESVQRHGVIGTTLGVVSAFRRVGALVVWTRAAFQPGYPELILNTGLNHAIKNLGALIDGSPGAQIIPDLSPQHQEPVVSHPGTSPFPNTALDSILRHHGIDTVLFTGVATNVTVEGSARDAVNLGYNVILVSDACAAATDEAHEATLATFSLLGKTAAAEDIQSALDLMEAAEQAPLVGPNVLT